jgi:hypothetical protein
MKQEISKFNENEKDLFEKSFSSDIINRIRNNPENSDITRMFNTASQREKLHIAFGKDRASQIEAKILLEQIANSTKNAVHGNSNTAHNIMDSVKKHASHGVGALGAVAALEGGPEFFHYAANHPFMAAAGALGALGAAKYVKANNAANRKVLEATGRILAGHDPSELMKGIKEISENKQAMQGLRMLHSRVTNATATMENKKHNQPPVVPVGPQEEDDGTIKRKSGGRVSSTKEKSKKLFSQIKSLSSKNKKTTNHLLHQPDETIVHALRIANQRA